MELAFTPFGRITLARQTETREGAAKDPSGAAADRQLGKAAQAFAVSQGEGLFVLATERFEGLLGPSLFYWRDFAVRYLTALCHTPETAAEPAWPPGLTGLEQLAPAATPAIPPPDAQQRAAMQKQQQDELGAADRGRRTGTGRGRCPVSAFSR